MGTTLSESADGVKVNFIEKRGTWEYMTTTENSFDVVLSEDDIKTTVSDDRLSYTITKNESITIGADSEYNTYQTQSFTFTNAVKSIETLMTNWFSAAGAIKHDGIVPSMSYKWFIGMWAWDSWKQVVATTYFNEELAKDNVRALFDYQIKSDDAVRPQDAGAIIDCIFYNQNEDRGGEHGQLKMFIVKLVIKSF